MLTKTKLFFAVFRVLGLFLMGLAVATVIALSQVNLETLRGNVLAILRDATGLPVQIDGAVSWKLSLRPKIELHQVRVPNADWARHKYAFSAEKIDVTMNLVSLFRDRPTIQNVKIYDATACVEQNADGQYSIMPEFDDDDDAVDKKHQGLIATTSDSRPVVQEKYPFKDPGLGSVEIKNLVAHVLDSTYSISGFSVHYVPKDDVREYAGWIKSKSAMFPFIVSYSQYNPERKIYPVKIAVSTGGDALIANVALEGTSLMPIDFIVKGDIPNITEMGEVIGLELLPLAKISVNLAGGFDHHRVTLRKSTISTRGNKITLSGDYDWSKKIPTLNLNLESKRISLMELFPDLYGRQWIRPKRSINVFKDTPLFGEYFAAFDFNADVSINELIVYRDLNLREIELRAKSVSGDARVDADVGIGGGNVIIGADILIAPDGMMRGTVGAVGRNISIGEILNQIRVDGIISDLPVDFETFLMANGSNLSEVMQTVTGPVRLYSTAPGYAHSKLVAYMYGTDFLTSLRHGIQDLFRTEKKHDQIKISCVALNTKLRSGVAETQNGVAVQTNSINVRLAGDLDLGGENMKLSLTTVPVRGLKLSLTGNVVNSIEITGDLAEPDIHINGAAVAGKVASATGIGLLLAPFTGGIGLVAGAGVGLLAGDLLENWLADDTPCETALRRGAPALRDDPAWLDAPIEQLLESVMQK